MQDRLKKLFEEIKLEETSLEYFDEASIEKVILYDRNEKNTEQRRKIQWKYKNARQRIS